MGDTVRPPYCKPDPASSATLDNCRSYCFWKQPCIKTINHCQVLVALRMRNCESSGETGAKFAAN